MRAAEPEPTDSSLARRALSALGIVALFAFGIWGLSPVLLDDAPRLDSAYRMAIWIGEASLALYLVRWVWRGPERGARGVRVLLGLLLSIGVDIGVTAYGRSHEFDGHARSLEAMAKIEDLQSVASHAVLGGALNARRYRIVLAYRDARGTSHRAALRVTWSAKKGWPSWLDKDVAAQLDAGAVGSAVRVRYDPEFPLRAWLAGQPWERQNTLSIAFLTIHFLQGLALILLLVHGLETAMRPSRDSLWAEKAPITLVWVEAGAVAFLGLLAWLRTLG